MTQALILANALAFCDSSVASQAAAELRAQHARIAELEQGKCLHQIAEPAANLTSELADMLERSVTGLGHYRNSQNWSEADEEHINECNALLDRFNSSAEELAAAPQAAVHPDDAAVDALAALMKTKLEKQRDKGYGGWNDKTQCSQQRLSDMLRAHVDKGDPVDVANFCAFLLARGEGIAAAPQAVRAAVPDGWRDQLEQALCDLQTSPHPATAVAVKRIEKLLVAPAHPAEGVPAQAIRDAVIQHLTSAGVLEHDGCGIFIASGNASELIDACATLAATHPTQQGLYRQQIDPLRQMIAQHQAHLEQNQHAYFELAYTRSTGWMVWITDKPLCSPVVNPDRKVLWRGQGDTPDEACENAALAAQAKQGEQANG